MASMLFMDWETQSDSDLPVTGTLRYVLDPSTRPLLLSWAVDAGDLRLWCPDLSGELVPEVWAYVLGRMWCYGTGKARNGNGPPFKGVPAEIVDLCARPDGYVVAWNSSFDRQTWQQIATPDYGFPRIEIEQTLDAMAQGQASNLPGQLEWAGRMLGLGQKTVGGKAIMQRFARRQDPLPGSKADIENLMAKGLSREKAIAAAIEAWDLYLTYSVQDTALLRDVWNCTRPLDGTEWQEYWTSERINDRGMLADLDVCRGAVSYREEEALHVAAECERLTDGAINSPTLTKQINEWLYERLPEDLAAGMVKQRDEETGEATRLTGAKDVMTRLLEDIQTSDTPPSDDVTEFVELLQFGRSSSAVKFEKILNQEVDGRLSGSYVFNGAGQTGRYSSRGVQVHNLPRAYLENELDVLDMVAAGVPIDRLREIGPVSSVLAKLIRPTFIAPPDKTLVWGDWSAIEARVNPWLAKTRDADEAVLAPFRNGDDLYILNAEAIFNIPAATLYERYAEGDKEAKGMRQAGKVAVLALGFLGSVGALKAMARGYGMRLNDEEARLIVDGWRDRNRWARRFGDKCEEAAFSALSHPLQMYPAGRLTYQFVPGLMGGTLVCFLPDGRPIVYPKAKIKKVEKFGKDVDAITYLNGMGYRALWNGLMVENGTQATAASILRQTLVRLEADEPGALVGHTHDEVIGEVPTTMASGFAERLEAAMVAGFDWTEGLPLAAEVSTNWFYTKSS